MIENAVAIFFIGLLGIISPGPDCLLMLRNSLRGRAASVATATGINLGCLIQIGACVLGISVLLQQNERVFSVVRSCGALYLIYLGIKGISSLLTKRSLISPVLETEIPGVSGRKFSYFSQGFFCNLLNPKFTLFLLSIFTQFSGPQSSLGERFLYGATLWLQAVFYWYFFAWLLQGHRIQSAVTKFGRVVDPVLGAVLAGLGIRILIA